MLNIDSEPMATPMTKLRRAKNVRSTSGALARDSTISGRKNAAAASTNGPIAGSGAALACGHGREHERGIEPEDHAPAREVSERAAEQRPDAEAKHQKAGPCADRCCPALRRRAGVERGQRAGHR